MLHLEAGNPVNLENLSYSEIYISLTGTKLERGVPYDNPTYKVSSSGFYVGYVFNSIQTLRLGKMTLDSKPLDGGIKFCVSMVYQ